MSMIRRMNIKTGAPATEADEAAGVAHDVLCDHQGRIVRDAQGRVTSYGGPETRDAQLNREGVELLRSSPQRRFFNTADLTAESEAATRAEMVARFGPQSVGPAQADSKSGDVQVFPADRLPDYGPGVTVRRTPQMG